MEEPQLECQIDEKLQLGRASTRSRKETKFFTFNQVGRRAVQQCQTVRCQVNEQEGLKTNQTQVKLQLTNNNAIDGLMRNLIKKLELSTKSNYYLAYYSTTEQRWKKLKSLQQLKRRSENKIRIVQKKPKVKAQKPVPKPVQPKEKPIQKPVVKKPEVPRHITPEMQYMQLWWMEYSRYIQSWYYLGHNYNYPSVGGGYYPQGGMQQQCNLLVQM